MKYAKIQAFSDPYFPIYGQNRLRISPYSTFQHFLMCFLFVNRTYSQITKEPYGFKIQIFRVSFSEVREPTNKFYTFMT